MGRAAEVQVTATDVEDGGRRLKRNAHKNVYPMLVLKRAWLCCVPAYAAIKSNSVSEENIARTTVHTACYTKERRGKEEGAETETEEWRKCTVE